MQIKSTRIQTESIQIAGALFNLDLLDTGGCFKVTAGGQKVCIESPVLNLKELIEAFAHMSSSVRKHLGLHEKIVAPKKAIGRPRKYPRDSRNELVNEITDEATPAATGARRVMIDGRVAK